MNSAVQRFGVVTAFALLGVLLIGNAFVTRRQLGIQTGRQHWVVHSRLMRYEIQQTLSFLEDAETGQRGYLYTGDPRYLGPYNHAGSEIDAQLKQLSELSADNPQQAANVAAVRDLAARISTFADLHRWVYSEHRAYAWFFRDETYIPVTGPLAETYGEAPRVASRVR